MKNNIQTILNVCFAISITAFIYQNDKQQDRIDTLETQADVSKSLKDIDALMYDLSILEVEVETHKERFVTLINNWEQQDTYNNGLKDLLDKVADSVNDHETEMQNITKSIADIERSIRRLPKPKSTQAIKNIIQGCEVDTYAMSGPMITNMHGHKTLKC
jgi:hypothetical protein